MLAYDYPLLGMFWTILMVFLWIAWLMLLFSIIADVFRSDMGGFSKALWLLVVIVVPLLGALIYVLANGDDMAKRSFQRAQENEAATRAYIQSAAGGASPAEEIAKLNELRNSGVITDEEFQQQKAKALAG